MARAIARRRDGYTHDVTVDDHHKLVVDEPEEVGGKDAGPSPSRLLAASLAACTAITMEMYADRKGWDIDDVEVEVDIDYEGHTPKAFDVAIRVPKELSDDQRDRLLVIAKKCPVHQALTHEIEVKISDHVELL